MVILHDTNVHGSDFGVAALFGSLVRCIPISNFYMAMARLSPWGPSPDAVRALCTIPNAPDRNTVGEKFAHLGARWSGLDREQMAAGEAMRRIEVLLMSETTHCARPIAGRPRRRRRSILSRAPAKI